MEEHILFIVYTMTTYISFFSNTNKSVVLKISFSYCSSFFVGIFFSHLLVIKKNTISFNNKNFNTSFKQSILINTTLVYKYPHKYEHNTKISE